MEDRDAAEADATDTFEEAPISLFNTARMGAPPKVLSLLACIAAFASASVLNATNQVLVLPSMNADFGRIISVENADSSSIGLTSAGKFVTATRTLSPRFTCCIGFC